VSRAAAEVGSTANSYQILAKLASGGMADIFLARGEGVAGVERYCVLKRILRDRASDVHFVRMFLDEARLAAQLQHPNIAQVYDIGKLGDSYFFTMEYVHGETVRALLHRAQGLRRTLPITSVLTIAAGAAAGLHHAHVRVGLDGRALGIVHRDVSPSNLMVSYEGGVKLVDFGVAKADDRSQETKSGTVKGKISYLSPEQCRGKRVDRRSDLFSLGICVWEMLTTERLYRRSSDFENMNAIVSEPTPPPSSRRPDVPPEIDALVLRLLAKSPDDRFQTADEVVETIEAVASRTSSVLSASGLGRFVRELFGQRPEPWLELESQHGPGEAVTVTSEPIPRELGIAQAEEVDHQLSSVVDLSSPRSVTASLDELQPEPAPFDVPTAQLGRPAKRGFPLAAPPPTHPGTVSAASASRSTSVRPSGPTPVVVPPPDADVAPPPSLSPPPSPSSRPPPSLSPSPSPSSRPPPSLSPSPSSLSGPSPLSGPRPVPVVSPASVPLASGSGAGSGSGSASGSASGSGSVAVAASAAFVAASASASAAFAAASASAAFAAVPSAHDAARRRARPRRLGWPLVAVIGGAALVGSIAVVVLMRAGSSAASDAARAALAAGEAGPPAVGPRRSSITAEPIDVTPGAAANPPTTAMPGEVPAAVESAAPGAGPGARAGEPSRAPTGAVPSGPVAVAPAGATNAGSGVHPAPVGKPGTRAPPRSAAPTAPGHATVKREPPPDDLARLYAAEHYDRVITQCGGPVSADHAPLCFLAACHLHDEAAARRLITAVPAARRDPLAVNCKQLGVDIKKADCEADPMACQH
jgi:serine/threonine protein kinase